MRDVLFHDMMKYPIARKADSDAAANQSNLLREDGLDSQAPETRAAAAAAVVVVAAVAAADKQR